MRTGSDLAHRHTKSFLLDSSCALFRIQALVPLLNEPCTFSELEHFVNDTNERWVVSNMHFQPQQAKNEKEDKEKPKLTESAY